MEHRRWWLPLVRTVTVLTALAVMAAGCGGPGGVEAEPAGESAPAPAEESGDESAEASAGGPVVTADPEAAAQVVNLCQSVLDFHSAVIDSINDMSSLEVDATPSDRAVLLADGIDDIIELGETVELPTEPTSLTAGLADRKEHALADLRIEAEAFRSTTPIVEQDDRLGKVNKVFLLAEKLMSETEPKINGDTPNELIDVVRTTRTCRFVVQLPLGN